jgi:hypothetical protein
MKNSGPSILRVTASSSNVITSLSPNFVDGASCTQQISSPDTYVGKTQLMSENALADLAKNFKGVTTETEWCVKLVLADLSDGDYLDFRIVRGISGQPTSLEQYLVFPRINVSISANVVKSISHVNVSKEARVRNHTIETRVGNIFIEGK